MILFYSDFCKHCKMLLDTIERLQAKSIQLVSIESLRANKKTIPPQIHSVPALMILPSKQLLFGKQVFDYLLLPGKGVLTTGMIKPTQQPGSLSQTQQQSLSSDPEAFSLIISNASGDNFAFIDDDGIDKNRSYVWTSINDVEASSQQEQQRNINEDVIPTAQTSTRVRKETLDLEEFKAKRAEDLNIVVNTNIANPPATTY